MVLAVRKVDISAPLDFVHEVHVGFDADTGEFSVGRAVSVLVPRPVALAAVAHLAGWPRLSVSLL